MVGWLAVGSAAVVLDPAAATVGIELGLVVEIAEIWLAPAVFAVVSVDFG